MPKIAGRRIATVDRNVVYPKKNNVADVVGEGSRISGEEGLRMQKKAAAGAWVASMKRRAAPTQCPGPIDVDADVMDVDMPELSFHHHPLPHESQLSPKIHILSLHSPILFNSLSNLHRPPRNLMQHATPPTSQHTDPPHSHFPIEHAIEHRLPPFAARTEPAANGITATASRDGSIR